MTEPKKIRGINLHSRASVRHRMITDEPAVVTLLGALDWGSLDRGTTASTDTSSSSGDGTAH
ncbi:MAG: hypothetical protein V7608_3816 [Hyphomicrobiales bacterium]|jgi:hypothetical protein